MKILVVTPYLASVYGGTFKVVKELAEATSNLVEQIDIITTNASGWDKLELPLGVWIHASNYKTQYFSCWHKYDLIFSPSLIQWLYNNAANYDLVHIHTIFSPLILATCWVCNWHRVPYIVTPHGMLEPWALSYKAGKKKVYFNWLEKPALHRSAAIHLLASSEANSVKKMGLHHGIAIPNGIHCQEFEELPDPEIFYRQFPHAKNKSLILFLGRIDPKKGLDLLAVAFAVVRQQFPNSHLIIAGPDSIGFLPTVQKYFADAGCLDSVTFTGMLVGNVKLAALAAADVYVAPSYSEGFSMSVLEGMASGLPCVITTGCNFPEADMAEAAYVVSIDAKVIADTLIECLTHPQQAKATGDRARQFIFYKYTWEHTARQMTQLYKSVLNRSETYSR